VVGTGVPGLTADGLPGDVTEVRSPNAIAAAPDGSLYFISGSVTPNRTPVWVRRMMPDGLVYTVNETPLGLRSLDVDRDGTLYVGIQAGQGCGFIHRYGPDAQPVLFAGVGSISCPDTGDGGPAVQAGLKQLGANALSDAGTMYLKTATGIRAITPDAWCPSARGRSCGSAATSTWRGPDS